MTLEKVSSDKSRCAVETVERFFVCMGPFVPLFMF